MAKNPSISDLDAGQAFKRAMDGTHDAIRVVQALNTEMVIELSAEDGDSIQSVARSVLVKPEDGAVDCSSLRRICKYGEGVVAVSPDGVLWVELACSNLEVKEVCASKIMVTDCVVVGQS
jgi:hypothetical protein